ncbi:MAG: ABC transporter substrate-binding protein [Microbacterium sp.]|uniref:Oligopeptide transport system substrate-binding protein n=1 Tax=Microbacterium natoriense TaxID=284570 RepID=A0AAW8EW71_9MICO|nr:MULTISPECIES: ABC transporter substrate-binding protein [Microbacterium]MBW8762583.1 ABC transporter substrate-binding protein [Microbacterium sp.]MDQ0647680.1 oligopeptide transport system substrate-binding protein [Microbacterium natoriense]
MKRNRIALAGTALLAAGVMALAGCSAGNGDAGNGGEETGASTGIVTVQSNEPQNPLLPAVTNEVGGGLVLQNIFAGLVYYEADGKVVNDLAESIESEDNQTWTIKIKKDQEFSDGTPVTAESFVKAWQYAASDPAFENQWWFANFAGYNDGGDDPDNPVVVEDSLSLEAVDDTTFTVELAAPQSDFPTSLGYQVFSPLPESFFDDPETFGQNPVGNGPYKLEKWEHDAVISLVPNDKYDGPRKAQNGGVDLVVYGTADAAYADLLSDNLDVINPGVPPSALATYKDDLGDRAVDQPAAIWEGLTIPARLAHFGNDEEGNLRRQAISYAIDRDQITDVIFEGTRTPAVDYTSPVIAGWNDEIKGSEVTHADADKAKELWAQADAISPWSGTFTIAYNADGGHQPWVDAVSNQIKNTLGIDAAGQSFPDLATLRAEIKNRTLNAATRSGWQFDYPGAYNILGALFITGAGSNDGDYSNPKYDELVQKGATAPTVEEGNALFEQAQEVLFADLPVLPLWYRSTNAGYSTAVEDVAYGWDSWPIIYQITKAE